MYPEVFVIYNSTNNSKRVFLRRNGTWSEAQHDPWFLAETVPAFKSSEDERAFDNLVKAIEPSDVEILLFNEKTWRYDVRKKALKIATHSPLDIRRLVKLLEKHRAHHALSNISYIARCSLDLIDSVFGYRTPLILYYGEDNLEQILADIYEKSKSLRVLTIDIEVESKGSFPRPGDRILLAGIAISALGADEPEVIILEGDDVYKLADIVLRSGADYVTGFNAIGFDLPYYRSYTDDQRIIASVQQAGLVDNDNIVPLLDLYLFAKSYGPSLGLKSHTSRSLDQVAKDLGLITKKEEEIERSVDRNNIAREYQENRAKLLKYLEVDVKLTFRIARKWLPVLIVLHSLTGISPYSQQWLPSMGSLAEYALTEYIRRKHRIALEVRSRRWDFGEVEEFIPWISKGHKVIAVEGVYSNVAQIDFDMLYPTIGFEYKVDPTSVSVSDFGFPVLLFYEVDGGKKKEKVSERQLLKVSFSGGPVHEFFSKAYEVRKVTKKLRKKGIESPDAAAKVLANSVFGIFSKARGSGLNEVVSAFIFTKANQILNCTRRFVEQMLRRKVIYGDTDSLFIVLEGGDDPKTLEEAVNKFVKLFGEGFSVKLEALHEKTTIYSAKNYLCLTNTGEVIVKGLHRYHIPSAVKENLPEIVRRILGGEEPRKVIEEILRTSKKVEDLFVYSVKPLDELYDEDERRFKESTHAVSRAILLAYLSSVVGFTPKEGQVLRGTSMDIVVTAEDVNSGIILSAYWLTRSSDVVCILRRVVGADRAELLCGRFLSKPTVTESAMRQPVVVWVEEVDRGRLIDMALRTSKTLIETLFKIHSMVLGGSR